MKVWICGLAMLVGSCAHVATKGEASGPPCAPEATLPAGWAAPGAVVLLGEMHGTRELPAFFAEVVCQAAHRGPVVAGLEIPRSEQPSVDRYLGSAGAAADRDALLAGPFWRDPVQDGRRSEATQALLARLRDLRAAGLTVEVLLFDVEQSEQGPGRDQAMARNLEETLRRHPGAPFLVYTGNVHARTTIGVPWSPQFRPMGWHLRQAGVVVRSLDARWPDGTAWVCWKEDLGDPTGQMKCGPRPLRGSASRASAPGISLFASPSQEGFDGAYSVATLTASPPAAARR